MTHPLTQAAVDITAMLQSTGANHAEVMRVSQLLWDICHREIIGGTAFRNVEAAVLMTARELAGYREANAAIVEQQELRAGLR